MRCCVHCLLVNISQSCCHYSVFCIYPRFSGSHSKKSVPDFTLQPVDLFSFSANNNISAVHSECLTHLRYYFCDCRSVRYSIQQYGVNDVGEQFLATLARTSMFGMNFIEKCTGVDLNTRIALTTVNFVSCSHRTNVYTSTKIIEGYLQLTHYC